MSAVVDERMQDPAAAPARSPLRVVLLAVIVVGLLLIGGGAAVALGIGQQDTPTSDSVDAGFARDMSTHHLQGVEMANLALTRATDPQVLSLAFDIRFLQLMIRHHQGGRPMAEYAAAHAQLEPVRSLARSIVDTQTAETTTMSAMLTRLGGTPLPPPS